MARENRLPYKSPKYKNKNTKPGLKKENVENKIKSAFDRTEPEQEIKIIYNDYTVNVSSNFKGYTVYAIVNIYNKRVYIGMTSDFERRKSEHFSPEYRAKEKKILYKYMQEMGAEAFKMIPIFSGLSKQDALYAQS
jgi:predicted GIY-YIG superfamily endonuclease